MSKQKHINEGIQRQLEKYAETTWNKLDLQQKILALKAINASGSGQAIKHLQNLTGQTISDFSSKISDMIKNMETKND